MANKPNNPSLWSKAKSLAKQKFDVYPSAYANGWAAKWYKSKGGTWRKAKDGMEVPYMSEGGKPEWLIEAQLKAQGFSGDALKQKLTSMAYGGEPQNAGFQALPERVQNKILSRSKMQYGGNFMMQAGGNFEPNGEMALGQMAAVQDKMNKLRQFVNSDDNLDPWIASKLAVMDHSADAIADYLMYSNENDEPEMEEMRDGGYTVTRSNDRKGKTHKVTGPDGTVKYFGDSKLGQHPKDPKRKKAFYARHKKNLAGNPYFRAFARATWADGGQLDYLQNGGIMFKETASGDISIPNLTRFNVGGYFPRFMEDGGDTGTFSGNAYYQQGGMMQQSGGKEQQIMQLIQAYAQISQIDPKEIVQQLQQMQPQEQQQAVQKMAEAVQQASSQGGQPQMKSGGMPCFNCGGMYQDGGEMGGMYMPSSPAVSIYDLPIYQEDGLVLDSRWHPEWYQQYSDEALSGEYDQQAADDALVAEANAQALEEYPGPVMQQFQIPTPASSYQGNSIVDYLASMGSNSSYASRKALAAEKGIENYRGTAAQNIELLNILRGGKSTIPTGKVTARSAAKKAESNSDIQAIVDKQDPDNILRQGYKPQFSLYDNNVLGLKGYKNIKGKGVANADSDFTGGEIAGIAIAGGITALLAGAGLTAADLIGTDWEKLGSNSPFSGQLKRQLTIARKKLINEAMKQGAKSAKEAVDEFKRAPKKLQNILKNLDAMEIAGDVYQTRPGTAARDLQAWNALNESRAEQSIMNQQDLMRMQQESAEEAKALRSASARKGAATRAGKSLAAPLAAEENAFMRALKTGYGAMREAPLVTKAGKLLKYIRKEDGGELDMMQDGEEFTPEWWGRQAIQLMDPTGITSYGDVYDSWNDPNASGWDRAFTTFSALPIVGKIGKGAKLINTGAKVAKGSQKISKAANVYNKAAKVLTPVRAFDNMNPLGAGVAAFNRSLLQDAPRAAKIGAGLGSDFNQGRRFFQAGELGITGLDRAMGYTPKQAYGGYMDPAWMKAGGIHINPANKGKFTASANRAGMGVQEFARHVLANKEDYSSTQVKRANFARNAAKWKKQEGGSIEVGSYVDDTPEMRAWLDANGYTYE